MDQVQSSTETSINTDGKRLMDEVKQAFHAGATRRIVVKQDGEAVVEMPLLVGMAGAVLAPPLAAIGALTALLTNCTIGVERTATAAAPDAMTLASPATDGIDAVPESPPPDADPITGDGAVMTVTVATVENVPSGADPDTVLPEPVPPGPALVFGHATAAPSAAVA